VVQWIAVWCSVVQCVAVWYSMLQCDAGCCSVLQYVAVCCSVLQCDAVCCNVLQYIAVYCSVYQCVAVCCSVQQCAAVCSSVQDVAVCCSVYQCVAVCCNVIQYFTVCCSAEKNYNWLSGLVSRSWPPLSSHCMLQCVAVCSSVLLCVAALRNVLQCVAVRWLVSHSWILSFEKKPHVRKSCLQKTAFEKNLMFFESRICERVLIFWGSPNRCHPICTSGKSFHCHKTFGIHPCFFCVDCNTFFLFCVAFNSPKSWLLANIQQPLFVGFV